MAPFKTSSFLAAAWAESAVPPPRRPEVPDTTRGTSVSADCLFEYDPLLTWGPRALGSPEQSQQDDTSLELSSLQDAARTQSAPPDFRQRPVGSFGCLFSRSRATPPSHPAAAVTGAGAASAAPNFGAFQQRPCLENAGNRPPRRSRGQWKVASWHCTTSPDPQARYLPRAGHSPSPSYFSMQPEPPGGKLSPRGNIGPLQHRKHQNRLKAMVTSTSTMNKYNPI